MISFLRKNILFATVFVTGAAVLVVEIVAVRILSPYFGSSLFTVSSVLSVILAALSLGYYIGGKQADRNPSKNRFFSIILISGILILGLHLLSFVLLPVLSSALSLSIGPLISALLLFFIPAFILGTLSPLVIKLITIQFPEQGIGSISGKVFFWSTLGSISGSLATGFLLIPNFGVNEIMLATGALLFLLGLLPQIFMSKQILLKKKKSILFFVVLFILDILVFGYQIPEVVHSYDGIYENIVVYDGEHDNRPARFFKQDLSSSGAMFLDTNDSTDLVYDYTKYYSLYRALSPDPEHVLVIGGGAYSIPRALLAELPDVLVDVSEIEPGLLGVAHEYFDLPQDSRLVNSDVDGRQFLRQSNVKYDMIFSDVYDSIFSIPSHFTTQEFFELAHSSLTEDGIFIGNMIGNLSHDTPSFFLSEMKTFQSVFPHSLFFAVTSPETFDNQNIMFVGSSRPLDFEWD